ncbi:glycosyltransferase 87 family protein [Mycobacterium asiaticum]|uniref:glycosyltransferase 87 family protein n=1 Tax=Mycobacterium asiaticum TaxID=1790 RepID=UPI00130201F0|nr:glycosyltransferase 87 family protein [Mycobacterium asiaticum]
MTRTGCFSDTASLFESHNLANHVFPYIHSWYTSNPPTLHGGAIEYPTLTGLWAWATALFASDTQEFLVLTALSFAAVVLVTTLCLYRLAGRRAWIWAASPPLALYALYNWDILPVAATSLGLLVAVQGPLRWPRIIRAIAAGVAFGVGGAFKLYPLLFIVPLALAILLNPSADSRAERWRNAGGAIGGTLAVLLAANLPFLIINSAGWLSVFQFQAQRPIDGTTLSLWSQGFLPLMRPDDPKTQSVLGTAATVSTLVGISLAVVAGIAIGRRQGAIPWVQTAAAMLCAYMLFNKVHSPQYVLWLLPFFVTVRIRIRWIVTYLLADLAVFIGWYRTLYYHFIGDPNLKWAEQVLACGIWGRALLLVVLAVVFLRSPLARSRQDDLGRTSTEGVHPERVVGAVGTLRPPSASTT